MDQLLKLTADAGLEVTAAEDALDEGAHQAARDALDRAADVLTELRERWPTMSASERALVGKVAATVRERLDAAAARLPARQTLAQGEAEVDPEQDAPPDPSQSGEL